MTTEHVEKKFLTCGWQPLWGVEQPFHSGQILDILYIKYLHYDV